MPPTAPGACWLRARRELRCRTTALAARQQALPPALPTVAPARLRPAQQTEARQPAGGPPASRCMALHRPAQEQAPGYTALC